jgi:hypothetical protein
MFTSREAHGRSSRLRTLMCMAVAALVVSLPGAADARARVTTFTDTFPMGPDVVWDECAGMDGVLTGTGTIRIRLVQTDSTDTGRATELVRFALSYRIDFPDGSYLLSSAKEQKAVLYDDTDGGGFSGTVQDVGTLYSADGQVIGREMFHGNYHGVAEDGAAMVTFDRGRVTCR